MTTDAPTAARDPRGRSALTERWRRKELTDEETLSAMSHYGIRPVDRSCGSYGPGHQVHWIQAKKSAEDEQPVIEVSIVVHHDGRVEIEGDELKLTMWNHEPDRLRDAVDYCRRAVWKPRFHVLAVPGGLRLPI
jgi:hypothetical protein